MVCGVQWAPAFIYTVEADKHGTWGLFHFPRFSSTSSSTLMVGWMWPCGPGGCVHVLSSLGEGSWVRALWPRGSPPSLPRVDVRGLPQGQQHRGPSWGGRPPPLSRPCNRSRSPGSQSRAGSHRYQLTTCVPFSFTRGQLTMADSPHGGPGPPRERPLRAIGPHDLAP